MFDDLIIFSEGQIVYQGPRESAIDFFAFMGFKFPPSKNVADFLQEVISKKDQQRYWCSNRRYKVVSVSKFAEDFQSFCVGNSLSQELAVSFDKGHNHPAVLSTNSYGITRTKLLGIGFSWQTLK